MLGLGWTRRIRWYKFGLEKKIFFKSTGLESRVIPSLNFLWK